MSDTALRAPSINLDEFERRLRATGSLGGVQEDPLAELARLLGMDEPSLERKEKKEDAPLALERQAMPILKPSGPSLCFHFSTSAGSGAR